MLALQPTIAEAVGEIPTPANIELAQRGDWLRAVMTRNWSGVDANLRRWRDGVVDYLTKTADRHRHLLPLRCHQCRARRIDWRRPCRLLQAGARVDHDPGTKGRVISLLELGQTADTTVRPSERYSNT